MKTPICDYVNQYAASAPLRLHMPGHKGQGILGVEGLDITEVSGADSLYETAGIIRESEENASAVFGCPTFYSTEGSSQCIRAMALLAMQHAKGQGRTPRIAAARNVHKTFLSAAALLDTDVVWLSGKQDSYLSCTLKAEMLEEAFAQQDITAVYITSPDYLGNMADVQTLAQVCHAHNALLLVDNAHGAYLRFLPQSLHPMDLGADLCCSSAHKTLPVLTGGAYLHTGADFARGAKEALALFGSTSPSYLILQSLDACNPYLEGYGAALAEYLPKVAALKQRLMAHGYVVFGQEPMKLTLCPKSYGYLGTELAGLLEKQGIVCEFADPDHLVFMPTPETGEAGLERLEKALLGVAKRPPILEKAPRFALCEQVCSIRQAMLSLGKVVPAEASVGCVLAGPSVGCPPAVPIVVCGQRIDENALGAFRYYGITHCTVME